VTHPDRWQHVERLFHDALARDESERSSFLREACRGDEPLRCDVESLLMFESDAQAFMQASAFEVAPSLIQPETTTPLVGQRLGPYEIGALLGAGGMGDVYRARDTTLGRDVAIKILPDVFTADANRRARFEREARLLATLNHPHIGAIYGFEQREGISGLVLELVEGQTLAERLRAGPLPVREALTIARQIADALDAAHEKGIVHRDLKPSNITITADGVVKVLDFGLAKASTGESARDVPLSPAVPADDTLEGLILGTAAYMSPEQARGKRVDKRTDIWAFGCVLYEMLTGRKAFSGETVSDTIAAILERDPDWSALPETTPSTLRRLLQHCLEKDPRRRLRDVGDAQGELDDHADAPVPSSRPARALRMALWTGSALLVGGLIVGLGIRFVPRAATNEVMRFTVTPPDNAQLAFMMALSPDGKVLVYSGSECGKGDLSAFRLYKRSLDTLESLPIRGAEGGYIPFFSPDGASVGFFGGNELKRIPLEGGVATTVLARVGHRCGAGAVWLPDDTIVFASLSQGLMRVPASGGEARPLTAIDRERGEVEHLWPVAVPGERAVLFTVHSGARATLRIDAVSLQTGQRTPVVEGNGGHVVASGHIAFERGGSLLVAPFDSKRLKLTGPPTPVVEGVNVGSFWSPIIAVGAEGSLAYGTGAPPLPSQQGALVWVDRTGRDQPVDLPARVWQFPYISPDGKRLGLHDHDPGNMDAWIYELDHGPLLRVTYDPFPDGSPLWSPDGTRMAFWSRRAGAQSNLYLRSADLSGSDERLTTSPNNQFPFSWADDGKLLVFHEVSPDTGRDIGMVSIEGEHRSRLIIRGPFHESSPAVSPDGHWIAYESNLSGRWEVYVQPFPELTTRWQVSTDGGESPTWRPDGRELFYRRGKAMMSVAVETTGNLFRYGNSIVLFEGSHAPQDPARFGRSYAVAPDGQRFLMIKEEERNDHDRHASIVVIRNWAEELKRRVPATR
jgi:serine/threonine-protein kinase